MHSSDTVEIVLWCFASVVAGSMFIVITLGLFKGVFYEQQVKARRK